MSKAANPFAFRAYEDRMKPENAPNYITPAKRQKIKEYLTQSSLTHNTSSFKGNDGYVSQYKEQMKAPDFDLRLMITERQKTIQRNRKPNFRLGIDKSVPYRQQMAQSPATLNLNTRAQSLEDKELKEKARSNLRNHHFSLGFHKGKTDFELDREKHEALIKGYLQNQGRHKVNLQDQVLKNKESSVVLGNETSSPFQKDKISDIPRSLNQSPYGTNSKEVKSRNVANQIIVPISNKVSSIKLGQPTEPADWITANRKQSDLSKTYQYRSIGKHDRTRVNIASSWKKLGLDSPGFSKIQDRNTIYGQFAPPQPERDHLINQQERNKIIYDMKTRKNVYLGPLRPTPNESSNQEAFKLDKIPDKKYLMATYQNVNLRDHVHLEQPSDRNEFESNSVSQRYYNNNSSKVDFQQCQENKDKIQQYKERILRHKNELGYDQSKDLNATIVQKDYTKHHDIDKSFKEQLQQRSNNKSVVERQNYNIFDHSGCEENQIKKIQLPSFNVKKDDNRDLFKSLKKSYLDMGHEQKNNLNSTSSQAYKVQPAQTNFNQYSNQKKLFDANRTNQYKSRFLQPFRSNSTHKGHSSYRDTFSWKQPKYDF